RNSVGLHAALKRPRSKEKKLAYSNVDECSDMYSTAHEGQKRGLLRPYGATHVGPVFRNLPLFGFLTALVVFFYVFYIYQAQNAELALMREEYSVLQQHLSKLKTENLDIKASLESCKDDEKSLQGEKSDANKKLEECASNLRSEKIRAESLKSDVAKVEVEIAECSRRVESAQSELLRLNGTMAAIHAVGMGNEALVITLNNTVNQLRGELARLKAEGHAESAVHVANELIQEAAPKAKMNSPTVSLIRAPGKSDHDEEMVKGNAQALAADEKNAAHLLYQDRGNDAKVFVVSSTAQSNADAQPHPLARRRGQEADSDADTDDLVLSGVEFIVSGDQFDQQRGPNKPYLRRPLDSDLAVGAEACTTPATGRPLAARKLQFDTTPSPLVTPKRTCLKPLNEVPSKAVTFNSEMVRGREHEVDSISSSEIDDDCSGLTQPFLHRYVDALNDIFSKAQSRIDDLNSMCIASAELDKFDIDMEASGKSAQFARIENLSATELRHFLRAEMLQNEQNDLRIEKLTRRNVQLEKRLAVTDTAEKHYKQMKLEMEKKLSKLLEEFGEVEGKRIERCANLIERNARLEKRNTLNIAQNETLNAQVAELNEKVARLKQCLQKADRDGKGLRCQVNSLQESLDSERYESEALRGRISELQKEVAEKERRGRELEDRLKEEEKKLERERADVKRLEEEMNREREVASERLKAAEQNLTHSYEVELDRKRGEYENDLTALSNAYEKNLTKARDEIARVKRERDDLVMKICEIEKNHEYFKRQVFIDAQQKLASSCQRAVTEFSGGVTSDRGNSSPKYASAISSTRPISTAEGYHSNAPNIHSHIPSFSVPPLSLDSRSVSASVVPAHRNTASNTSHTRKKSLPVRKIAPSAQFRRLQSLRKS
uniref:Uncharacterized protein n=1 Tax=Parascaris univalens TaxID=6257 RepID=A0A915C5A2_PARUN